MLRRALSVAASLAVAAASLVSGTPAPAAPSSEQKVAQGKGPVGWDLYRDLGRAAQLRPGEQSRQFSSFDRSGGNNDGFDGEYSCLRTSAAGCVIAERAGAGEIQSIWFTRLGPTGGGDVTDTGNILIELDGKPVLDAKLQDVVTGKLGAPFAWPLVGSGDDTSGGAVIKVPMPYRESMRVTVQHNPHFYHLSYRTFDDAEGVSTFDPADKATDVLDRLRGFGVRDPKPAAPGTTTSKRTVDVAAGRTAQLAELRGPGRITGLRLKLPQVARAPRVGDDGRAYQGGSSFKVAVDPANTGVRITKRFDPFIGNQKARLSVDGQAVGEWTSGAARPAGSWVDQAIEVPAALTAGKRTLQVANTFVSSDLDVNEFRYDVHSKVDGRWIRTDVLDLGPGHPGEQLAHGYTIDRQSWQGHRVYRYPVAAEDVTRSDDVLNGARLRISFDGRTTVDSPVGEFFGSGLGEYDTRTMFFGIDAGADGWYSAWWPMPYADRVKAELVNSSGQPIEGAQVELDSVRDPAAAIGLATGELGHFNATSKRANTVNQRDWVFLDAQGRGLYYGATHSMRGLIPSGNRRNYLEGDERVYVDGSASPAWYGTGSEDYYEAGWYFRDGTTYVMPTAGNPAYELDGDGCRYDCTGTYRLHVGDPVPFETGLRFGMEHGPASNEPGDYSSTAYWYGRPMYGLERSDALDVGDAASRAEHRYAGPAAAPLTSTYEGEDDDLPVTRAVASGNEPVSFRMAVAAANGGVRLTRTGDQHAAYQAADVTVDGQPAGRWSQPLGNQRSRWLEDSFDLPAALTAGKTSIDVTLTPVAGGPAWTAARYETRSRVAPFADRRAPGAVVGLTAKGEQTNEITLGWKDATDDVGVSGYEVYAAPSAGGPWTQVGTSPVPSFRHRGLGLRQTWHYRVRAVDGAGKTGAYSATASATSGHTAIIEGESMLPPVSADAPVEAQANCCGVVWSANQHLWFRADSAGDQVTVEFTAPETGTYDLGAVWTKAPDYGIVTLAVDGTVLGQPFDGYEPGRVLIAPPVSYPGVALTKGKHRLTLTVTGKNAASTGYLAGLDLLSLTLR